MNELEELKEIILGLDELIRYWIDGYNASLLSAGGDDVYSQADHYIIRALNIIENLENMGWQFNPFLPGRDRQEINENFLQKTCMV